MSQPECTLHPETENERWGVRWTRIVVCLAIGRACLVTHKLALVAPLSFEADCSRIFEQTGLIFQAHGSSGSLKKCIGTCTSTHNKQLSSFILP